ncbi:GNAT family N-acetyltransferase [Gracilibacillus timonensis]|uniref:GNAT family N-acetyltransferase n=1 Tax=Gracilibacillus timonensis TaxID=1816696 RepID=UPI0008243630|nr:GNAT family N-acetyltransferase [Gracilibacillus timonensis]
MRDIYFEENYGKLYEQIENGTSMVYNYEDDLGKAHHMFIKREIPFSIDENIYYDIVTPYGYGGPSIEPVDENKRDELVQNFMAGLDDFCTKQNIVSEFVRFHPLIENAYDFMKYYDVSQIRNTLGTSLNEYDDPFQTEFSKSCRKNIRQSLKAGVTYRITENPEDVSQFKDIYYSTMDRNKASEYYYFAEDYFNLCLEYFKDNLLLVEAIFEGEVIAMGFYFIYGDFIHTHLSGTISDYLHLSPAYILRYALTQWGKEKGYKVIHHGGGRSNDPNDSLYKFKKRFSKNTEFNFFIGKKIWNKNVYKQLCEMSNADNNSDFFPAYRSKA